MFFDIDVLLNKKIFHESQSDTIFLAGCDEAGRGPLAGPVVGACSFLKIGKENSYSSVSSDLNCFFKELVELGITDSKKLSGKKRRKILEFLDIKNTPAKSIFSIKESKNISLYGAICEISAAKIDEINILNASLLAMKESFERCFEETNSLNQNGIVLFDGNKMPRNLPVSVVGEAVVKGDSKSVLIGLASIVAKEYRDDLMQKLNENFPGYEFDKHAGYPTLKHREKIKELGVTKVHRKTFKGVREFL